MSAYRRPAVGDRVREDRAWASARARIEGGSAEPLVGELVAGPYPVESSEGEYWSVRWAPGECAVCVWRDMFVVVDEEPSR